MIYELRIYHCVTGRLPALLKRFETTTLELWKRHGIRQAGFWTVVVGDGGNQDLHYLLAWESLAERETKWNKFATDPEWLAKRAESERDGPIAYYVQYGAMVDGAGLRAWDVAPHNIAEVLRRYPRGSGFKSGLSDTIRAEARAVPGGRFGLLRRCGMPLAVRIAPFDS